MVTLIYMDDSKKNVRVPVEDAVYDEEECKVLH